MSSLAKRVKAVNWERPSAYRPFLGYPEIAHDGESVLIRYSKYPDTVIGTGLKMSLDAWQALTAAIKKGEFDF